MATTKSSLLADLGGYTTLEIMEIIGKSGLDCVMTYEHSDGREFAEGFYVPKLAASERRADSFFQQAADRIRAQVKKPL